MGGKVKAVVSYNATKKVHCGLFDTPQDKQVKKKWVEQSELKTFPGTPLSDRLKRRGRRGVSKSAVAVSMSTGNRDHTTTGDITSAG